MARRRPRFAGFRFVTVWADGIRIPVTVTSLRARTKRGRWWVKYNADVAQVGYEKPDDSGVISPSLSLRKRIYARDRTCIDCGESGEEIHHLTYELPLTEEKLVLLCDDCHHARHFEWHELVKRAAIRAAQAGQTEGYVQTPESIKHLAPWPPKFGRWKPPLTRAERERRRRKGSASKGRA